MNKLTGCDTTSGHIQSQGLVFDALITLLDVYREQGNEAMELITLHALKADIERRFSAKGKRA